ncbi:hypothetical protein LROSL1_1176 [Furfurilactobacillus rossiae]|uniref:HNH endonuclease signature motif containing protein n=1 Tax=Furfurilactobacillus rossiae TaxID=231049 RepID=UPI0015BF90BF|nr:HNH endonuclease signature motif containing protein [Furfurilactobacillus rossiae]QLE63993.1 hypothetical protein LROSL1_1176 [Furfurilactobacillus rossiae]
MGRRLLSDNQEEYLRSIIPGRYRKEIVAKFNERFSPAVILTVPRLKAWMNNRHVSSGLTGQFPKGHVPANKGKHPGSAPGSVATQFKKGQRPLNKVVVGTEVVKDDGYLWRKTAEPNVWKQVHRLNYEKEYGKIPSGHVIMFADGNRLHVQLDNLVLVTKRQMLEMNRKGLINHDASLTRTGLSLAKLNIGMYDRTKERSRQMGGRK